MKLRQVLKIILGGNDYDKAPKEFPHGGLGRYHDYCSRLQWRNG